MEPVHLTCNEPLGMVTHSLAETLAGRKGFICPIGIVGEHLQVLTHDANWADEPLSPRKRFSKAMRNHAERLIAGQVNGLHSKGMLCPDDDED